MESSNITVDMADEERFIAMIFGDENSLFFHEDSPEMEMRIINLGFLSNDEAFERWLLFNDHIEDDNNDNSSDMSGLREDPTPTDGRGRSTNRRMSRRKRHPYRSGFWIDYILLSQTEQEDPDYDIWNEESYIGAIFRQRFAVPYDLFHTIVTRWNATGEYRAERDKVGRHRIDPRLLLLGCLRVLAKGTTLDLIQEATKVSASLHHQFFHRFVYWFPREFLHKWIKLPQTEAEIEHVEGLYRRLGLVGCIGSTDCVHIGWDMCPASHRSDCCGKEGFPTVVFSVLVSHTRRILGVSQEFFGTWNDKTISKFDDNLQKIRNEEVYKGRQWSYFTEDGRCQQSRGLYLICDGGYCKWNCLMPPYKHQIQGTSEERWSNHVESIRKDVECTFGIMKKRFAILKNKIRLHNKEDIGQVFTTCCILHNMLHANDGLDDWETIQEMVGILEESFVGGNERIAMRDHTYFAMQPDELGVEDEIDPDFEERRRILINHYCYLRSTGYNSNQYR